MQIRHSLAVSQFLMQAQGYDVLRFLQQDQDDVQREVDEYSQRDFIKPTWNIGRDIQLRLNLLLGV